MNTILSICGWCPKGERVTILNAAAFKNATLIVSFAPDGRVANAYCAGTILKISDGICPTCRAANFPETVKSTEEVKA